MAFFDDGHCRPYPAHLPGSRLPARILVRLASAHARVCLIEYYLPICVRGHVRARILVKLLGEHCSLTRLS